MSDKRLLVQAGEFAAVLKVAARDGRRSPVLREAWDTRRFAHSLKTVPLLQLGRISRLAPISPRQELSACLITRNSQWVCQSLPLGVRRTIEEPPWGGGTQDVNRPSCNSGKACSGRGAQGRGNSPFIRGKMKMGTSLFKAHRGTARILGAISRERGARAAVCLYLLRARFKLSRR